MKLLSFNLSTSPTFFNLSTVTNLSSDSGGKYELVYNLKDLKEFWQAVWMHGGSESQSKILRNTWLININSFLNCFVETDL